MLSNGPTPVSIKTVCGPVPPATRTTKHPSWAVIMPSGPSSARWADQSLLGKYSGGILQVPSETGTTCRSPIRKVSPAGIPQR